MKNIVLINHCRANCINRIMQVRIHRNTIASAGDTNEMSFQCNRLLRTSTVFSLKPSWLQCANTAPVLLASLCICAICQGSIVNGFISTSISSLEKRFNLSSTQSGIFSAFYDVAVVLVLIPLSHFGNKCKFMRYSILSWGTCIENISLDALNIHHFFTFSLW